MSKRKIEAELKNKGIKAERVEYMRSCPTPSGYAAGWDVDIPEETVNRIYNANPEVEAHESMEFDSLTDVLAWVEAVPDLRKVSGGGK